MQKYEGKLLGLKLKPHCLEQLVALGQEETEVFFRMMRRHISPGEVRA